jgi:hypothetical protein
MKPAPQISSPKGQARRELNPSQPPSSAPLTDYNFQGPAETSACSTISLPGKKLHAFRIISRDFLGTEMTRDSSAELFLFALVAGISAWPVFLMIVAVTRMVRNY